MKVIHSLSKTRRVLLRTLAIALLAGITTTANAQIVFDDANGNASSDGASPTSVVFGLGNNIINGTVTSPSNTRNFYTFTIGAGQELTAINLDSLNVTSEGAPSTDPGFYALVDGTTSVNPTDGFANLGGFLYATAASANAPDPALQGENLLDRISSGGISDGSGFTNIGTGDYTFVIQQTGPEVSNFSLNFQVATAVPEPTSSALLIGLGLAGLARRRR